MQAPAELDGPLPAGERVGAVAVVDGTTVRRVALVTAARVPGAGPLRVSRRSSAYPDRAPGRRPPARDGAAALRISTVAGGPMIITVNLNAAIDKTLAVPNFGSAAGTAPVEQTAMAGGRGSTSRGR